MSKRVANRKGKTGRSISDESLADEIYAADPANMEEVDRMSIANAAGHYLGRLKSFREEQSRARNKR